MTLADIHAEIDSLEYALSIDAFDDSENRAQHMSECFLECRDAYAVPYVAPVITDEMRAFDAANTVRLEAELAELNDVLHEMYVSSV